MFLEFLVALPLLLTNTVFQAPPPESPTHIFMATSEGVKAFSLATSQVNLIVKGNAYGIAYDSTTKKIYASFDYFIIRRANVDGSAVEVVYDKRKEKDRFYLRGLSMDSSNRNLYAVTTFGVILVCNTTASPLTCTPTLQLENMFLWGNPALDPASGKMYFTSSTPEIWSARMDGSSPKQININANDMVNPQGITVDVANSKLYWTDADGDTIQSSDLNGQNVQTLVYLPTDSSPHGIAQLGNRIYWGTNGIGSTDKLQSCDAFGQDIRTHFTGSADIHQLALVSITE